MEYATFEKWEQRQCLRTLSDGDRAGTQTREKHHRSSFNAEAFLNVPMSQIHIFVTSPEIVCCMAISGRLVQSVDRLMIKVKKLRIMHMVNYQREVCC
jgi:hypothetical protein